MKTSVLVSSGPTSGFRPYLRRTVSTLASVIGPGFVAGLIAAGAGSRLAMRIMALTSSDAVQGARTEADAAIGEITLEGTIFLLLFGALIGALGGLFYLLIRRWMPGRGWKQGLVFGLVLLAVTGRFLVSPDNVDFLILEPEALAVAMFLALPLLYGALFVPLHEKAHRYLHSDSTPPRRVKILTAVSFVPLLPGPPILAAVVVGTLVTYLVRRLPPFWRSKPFHLTVGALLIGVFAVGSGFVAAGVLEIL